MEYNTEYANDLPLTSAPDTSTSDKPTARKGNYMHTSNGCKYWPLDPRAEEVHIDVIAHHLATRCRYNGAVWHPTDEQRIFYSVGEHSVYVALDLALRGASLEVIKAGLLHDGSEAFNGDLIRPLKYDPLFREPFKVVEERNERVIAERFKLPYPFPEDVKESDEAVTTAEVNQIVPKCGDEDYTDKLHNDNYCAPFKIMMLSPDKAKEMFLDLYELIVTGECPRNVQDIARFLEHYNK